MELKFFFTLQCLEKVYANFIMKNLPIHLQRKSDLFRKTPVFKSLFNKIAGLRPATLLKKTPTQVFSCEQSLHYVFLQYWGKLLNSFVTEIPII